jgi:glycosyltransferase involved in cell wall biosynthesis
VVSTAISAIPELLVDGHSGLLVPPEQVEPLAFAMERLLADSTLRQTLAQNGWEKIRNDFDVQRNVRQFAEALWPAWFKEAGIPESDAKVPVV